MTNKFDRKIGIGCSEVAAIMGLSKWKTPLQVYAEKKGLIDTDSSETEAQEWGNRLEPIVAKKWAQETGYKIRNINQTFFHPKMPYFYGHIDRLVLKDNSILEIKTTSAYNAKAWDGKIPDDYIVQCQSYMGILKKKKTHIACLLGGQRFVRDIIEFDRAFYKQIEESVQEFWENYILKNIMPVATSGDNEFMSDFWPTGNPDKVREFTDEDSERMNELVEQRVGGLQVIKDAKKDLAEIEAQIKQKLEDASEGLTNQYKITWRNQLRSGADIERMRADGVYKEYEKVSESRVLRTKKIDTP